MAICQISSKKKETFEGSIEADLNSMRFYEALGDSAGIGRCLNNIGSTHFSLKHYEESLDYYQQSLAISRQTGDTTGIAQILGNIGTAEKQLGNMDEALEAYLASNKVFEKLGYKRSIAFTLNNIGLALYREKGEFAKAEKYLLQVSGSAERAKSRSLDMANIYDNLAKTAIRQQAV